VPTSAGATRRALTDRVVPPPPSRRRWLVVLLLGLVVLVVVGVWFTLFALHRPHKFDLLDGRVYLGGADAVVHNRPLYAGRFTNVHLPFLYPPFAALGYIPLTWVPAAVAHTFIKAVNVVLLVVIGHVSCRESDLPRWARLGVTLALIGGGLWFEPVAETFRFGQLNLLLLALVLLDVTGRHGRIPQGVLTGIATGLKLTPGIFLVYLALTGRRRGALRGLATFVATAVLGLLVIPREAWHYWTGGFLDTHVGTTFIGNQSLKAVINRFGGSMHAGDKVWALCAVVVLVAGLFAAWYWQRRSELAGATLCGITGLLVSPISWTHHWVWAIPAVALAVGWAWRRPNVWRIVLALATIELWLSYAPWSVPFGDGREYHLHGVQLLTGNLYVWVGLATVAVAAVAALLRLRATGWRDWRRGSGRDQPLTAPDTVTV
jgi:alpha-1,2-mannosyltransferase